MHVVFEHNINEAANDKTFDIRVRHVVIDLNILTKRF